MSPTKERISVYLKNTYIGWRILSIAVVGAMLASIMITGYFIYVHIYRTLDNANTIVVLNSNVAIDAVNMAAYEKAARAIKLKESLPIFTAETRDIFSYAPTATPIADTATPFVSSSPASSTILSATSSNK